MFDVYDSKCHFTPLTDEQLATLTEPQLAAYNGLVTAVDDVSAVYAEHEAAISANRAAADALTAAQAAHAKAPKWTRLDEVRSQIEQTRPGYLAKNGLSLTVVDPSISAALNAARQAHVDCQIRLQAAADRRPTVNGNLAIALQRWQNATAQTITQEQLVRAHLAGETQHRADVAAGRVPERAQPRIANSKIDQFAYYTKQHGRGTGGGRAFGRSLVEGQKVFGPAFHGRDLPPKE
jgi:hypothetical protein